MHRFLFSCCVLCCCFAESATAHMPVLTDVRIGIANHYKNGLWTPIAVELSAPSQEIHKLAIRSSDSDGTPITYHYEISGEEAGKGKAVVLAKLGRKDETLQISLDGNSFQSYSVPPPVNAERPIYLIIGSDDIGLQGAVAELMLREDRRPLLVKVNSLANLPDKWFGYESVEMVVLTTTEPQLFDGLTAESPQIQALNDWVKLGGKMLLCAGKDAGQFLENEDGFLRLFLPGQFAEMTELRLGTRFELFVNSNRQIFMNGTEDAPFMKMPRFTEPRGITFVNDGDLPLVLRCAHGLGTIIYFGGDLSERPLKNWRDRSTLVRNIMQWNTEKRAGIDPRAGAMLQLGYNDIAGQIRSALDQFEGVRVVPFSVILLILTAYWLVIGLFDWFFVHKVLKRPILTWVTFPFWIVLFSVLTYALAAPGRPDVEKHNLLWLWDCDVETGIHRVSIWQGVYSPIDQQCCIASLSFSNLNASGYHSWYGLPGSGLGGMAPKTVSPAVWQVGSEQNSYGEITNVPIQSHSTKSFFSQEAFHSGSGIEIDARLSDEEGIPVGTIEVFTNIRADTTLQNCILVYGRWILELGELLPGQTIKITKTTPRRDLRDLLIPPKALEDDHLRRMATYNPQSADLEYILRVMSLHRALGGYESTGLHCAYQPSLDMSDLLTADRVLLLGVDSRRTAICRFSFPIVLTELSPRLRRERYDPAGGELEENMRPGFFVDPAGGAVR